MPDVTPCWLVWVITQSGAIVLKAVCLEEGVAAKYRKALKDDPQWVRVYVEPTKANHLYGGGMDEAAQQHARTFVENRNG